MEELGSLAVSLGTAWLSLVLALIVLPSALGVSLGISEAYMWVLVKTLEVGSPRVLHGRGARARGAGPPRRAGYGLWLCRLGSSRSSAIALGCVCRGYVLRLLVRVSVLQVLSGGPEICSGGGCGVAVPKLAKGSEVRSRPC